MSFLLHARFQAPAEPIGSVCRKRCQREALRAFSVSIESKRGSRFVVLTRFLNANRVHFAGKRYRRTIGGNIAGLRRVGKSGSGLSLPIAVRVPTPENLQRNQRIRRFAGLPGVPCVTWFGHGGVWSRGSFRIHFAPRRQISVLRALACLPRQKFHVSVSDQPPHGRLQGRRGEGGANRLVDVEREGGGRPRGGTKGVVAEAAGACCRDLRVALEQAGIEFLFVGEHAAGICKRDLD